MEQDKKQKSELAEEQLKEVAGDGIYPSVPLQTKPQTL